MQYSRYIYSPIITILVFSPRLKLAVLANRPIPKKSVPLQGFLDTFIVAPIKNRAEQKAYIKKIAKHRNLDNPAWAFA